MNAESNAMASPSPANEADAALQSVTVEAKAENLSRVAELSDCANEADVAAHIRGMVVATMGHLSADAPAITRTNADQWQGRALGAADGVTQTVPAGV